MIASLSRLSLALSALSLVAATAVLPRADNVGRATFYAQEGRPGACGSIHQDSDIVGEIASAQFSSSQCGRQVSVTNTNNGKSVTLTIVGSCPTCAGANDFDLSIGAFTSIANLDEGIIPISWHFV